MKKSTLYFALLGTFAANVHSESFLVNGPTAYRQYNQRI